MNMKKLALLNMKAKDLVNFENGELFDKGNKIIDCLEDFIEELSDEEYLEYKKYTELLEEFKELDTEIICDLNL